jgi:hypothetical protein
MSKGEGRSGRGWLWGSLGVGVLAIFVRVVAASHDVGLGLAVVALFAAVLYGLVVSLRRRAAKQLEAIDATGRVEFDAGLDFACLPGNWPAMARETLNPAGAGRMPSLPVRLAVADGLLLIDKRQRWSGRHPFHAEVLLADVNDIVVGKAQRTLGGSSLTVALRSDQEIRVDLIVPIEQAEALAGRLRLELPRSSAARQPPRGIVIDSAPPPLRTSPARSGLLIMVVIAPFAIAMAGAPNGPVADVATLLLIFYAVGLSMWRPPTMHRRLAVGLVLTSASFLIDAVATGDLWRLIGTLVCLAAAGWFRRLPPPSYTQD